MIKINPIKYLYPINYIQKLNEKKNFKKIQYFSIFSIKKPLFLKEWLLFYLFVEINTWKSKPMQIRYFVLKLPFQNYCYLNRNW